MSRGPGRVMRGVLDELGEHVRLNTTEVTAELFPMWGHSHLSSVRRALRALHRAGRVHCLGFDSYGVRVWCLPEYAGILTPPWAVKRDALQPLSLGEMLGERFTGALSREWNTSGMTGSK